MTEFIRPFEVISNFAEKVYNVGRFVMHQLAGGAWADLPHGELPEAHPPVRARITYIGNEDHLFKGEE